MHISDKQCILLNLIIFIIISISIIFSICFLKQQLIDYMITSLKVNNKFHNINTSKNFHTNSKHKLNDVNRQVRLFDLHNFKGIFLFLFKLD